jgi:hypothetical protein
MHVLCVEKIKGLKRNCKRERESLKINQDSRKKLASFNLHRSNRSLHRRPVLR